MTAVRFGGVPQIRSYGNFNPMCNQTRATLSLRDQWAVLKDITEYIKSHDKYGECVISHSVRAEYIGLGIPSSRCFEQTRSGGNLGSCNSLVLGIFFLPHPR